MDHKITKSEVYYFNNGKKGTLSVPYCAIQHLLSCKTRTGYNSGVYGWNADVYCLSNCAIVTGYRPFGKSVPYDLCKEYETKATKVLYSDKRFKSWKSRQRRLSVLLDEFCCKALQA